MGTVCRLVAGLRDDASVEPSGTPDLALKNAKSSPATEPDPRAGSG